jgi:hypothetical protein
MNTTLNETIPATRREDWQTPIALVGWAERRFDLRFSRDVACETHNSVIRRMATRDPGAWLAADRQFERTPSYCDRDSWSFHFDMGRNGLSDKWEPWHNAPSQLDACWCNPPYNALQAWSNALIDPMRTGFFHIVALVPAYTDTQWWTQLVQHERAGAVVFLTGRMQFELPIARRTSSARFPCALVHLTPYIPRANQDLKVTFEDWRKP